MSYWHTPAMPYNEFIPATKRGPIVGVSPCVRRALLALQVALAFLWYDMLSVVSAPVGAAA